MRSLAIVALVLATPAAAQSQSPLLGATPDTILLPAGWQLTPQSQGACLLTHRNAAGDQDLIIKTAEGTVALGVPVAADAGFSSPTTLTVVAEGQPNRSLGPTSALAVEGGLGMLLVSGWEPATLLPAIAHAARLAIYGPTKRLVRSVRLTGGATAVAALQERCGVPSR